MTVRLASFNILHGRSLTDGVVEAARLRAAAVALDADVLGMQEVDHLQARTHHLDLTAEVAAAMGAVDHRFVAALTGVPGTDWRPATADRPELPSYGVALVSRLPIREWHVLRLPATPLSVPLPVPGSRRFAWVKDEPRVVVAAELEGLTVAATHLSFVAGWNVVQLRRVRRWLRDLPGPQVLMGDLNMPRLVATTTTGWTSLVTAKTYPAPAPRVQLDHVLASVPLPVRSASAHEMELSDHRAVTVDLGGLTT
ncbi:MAG: Endonuclease/exonuclease/phosphatase [Frankiales bacterium]|nr:Endonuclease/exonuclease/phosphatase [Frankiales bacterium]